MENIEKLLKKIEFNYHNKDKKETAEFKINDETYNVLLLNRSEKANLIFSRQNGEFNNLKEIYEWLKPVIYKSFQLKEAAVEAKERGFIKSYYDVVDMLFEPFKPFFSFSLSNSIASSKVISLPPSRKDLGIET